jgi:tRNA threonylcarbamoyladenosine biosynthesis protein TsaB
VEVADPRADKSGGAMIVLAIDTALDACSAAVLDTDAPALLASESQPMPRGHAEALMPLIDRVMSAAGIAYLALDRIAVTVGPGSFTGLRVGLSAARGIGLAADKPVVGADDAVRLRRAAAVAPMSSTAPIILRRSMRGTTIVYYAGGARRRRRRSMRAARCADRRRATESAALRRAAYLIGNAASD